MSSKILELTAKDVKIELIQKNISRKFLKKKLKVRDAAISMALSGKRPQLLSKINQLINK